MKPATGELGLLSQMTKPGPRPRTIKSAGISVCILCPLYLLLDDGACPVSVILLFDVLCFPPFDGPIGEFGKSAPDATQHAVVLAAVKDAARR
jgi:hypothetical protein